MGRLRDLIKLSGPLRLYTERRRDTLTNPIKKEGNEGESGGDAPVRLARSGGAEGNVERPQKGTPTGY